MTFVILELLLYLLRYSPLSSLLTLLFRALKLCGPGGPPHVKLIIEWEHRIKDWSGFIFLFNPTHMVLFWENVLCNNMPWGLLHFQSLWQYSGGGGKGCRECEKSTPVHSSVQLHLGWVFLSLHQRGAGNESVMLTLWASVLFKTIAMLLWGNKIVKERV